MSKPSSYWAEEYARECMREAADHVSVDHMAHPSRAEGYWVIRVGSSVHALDCMGSRATDKARIRAKIREALGIPPP